MPSKLRSGRRNLFRPVGYSAFCAGGRLALQRLRAGPGGGFAESGGSSSGGEVASSPPRARLHRARVERLSLLLRRWRKEAKMFIQKMFIQACTQQGGTGTASQLPLGGACFYMKVQHYNVCIRFF